MSSDISTILEKAIDTFGTLAKDLKNELYRFGAITALQIIILLAIGWFYKDNLYPLLFAFLISGATNLLIISRASALKNAADVRRSAIQSGAELREKIEKEFEDGAQLALACLALGAAGIIEPKEAGAIAEGWKNNLDYRNVKGLWEKVPKIFALSLKAEYVEDGPII